MIYVLHQWINCILDILDNYIDVDFTLWLTWLLMPLLITFLLPLVILVLLYISAIILYITKFHSSRIREALHDGLQDLPKGALKVVAALWDAHGWIWHGYEIKGVENIPEGPSLLIYYHGTIPVDIYYLMARVFLTKNRLIHTVADRFLFRVPGFGILAEFMKVIPGTIQTCSQVLQEGNLMAISPGGVYEAQFGDDDYSLMWKGRLGFAKVAQLTGVPVVPVFTQNIRESFRCVGFLKPLFLKLYLHTRLPLVPIYGGFPVKMVTHIGKPIAHDPEISPEQLKDKVAAALEDLIEAHQIVPGSIMRGLFERIHYSPKLKTS